jgi:hypothetical protein
MELFLIYVRSKPPPKQLSGPTEKAYRKYCFGGGFERIKFLLFLNLKYGINAMYIDSDNKLTLVQKTG